MKKLTPYIFGVIGIAIGFMAGSAWILRMHTFVSWHQSSDSTSIQANLAVATLRSIRSGDTNRAIERMEEQLDNAVMGLADIYRECPRPQDATFLVRALTRAKEYRGDYPRKTGSMTIDEAVAKTFVLADQAKANLPALPSAAERGYGENPSQRKP